MKRTSLLALVVSVVAALADGQTRLSPRIVQPIDEVTTVTLGGSVHPLVASASSSVAADESTPMQHMILTLKVEASEDAALEQLIVQQNDPKSPLYHQFLSPKDFASRFGAQPADIAKLTDWLQQHGFTIDEIPAGNQSIVFSGTAGQVASTFKTEIRQYQVGGITHYANASNPQVPAAISPAVGGLVKLHDFRHGHSVTSLKPVSSAQFAHPDFTSSGGGHYLAPADYGTIYDINPLYSAGINGNGQSIAIIARSDIYMSDVQSFRSSFGLKANNPVFINTNSDPGVLQGDSVETTLDTEWSGAVAPNATIKVIISSSTNTSDGIDLAALYAVNNDVAPVISLSYGSCEAFMGSGELSFYNSLWKQAAAQGQTVLVSSGDSGAAGCDGGSESKASYGPGVNGLCSSPYSTCVGGTEFADTNNPGQYWLPGNNPTYGSATGYIPETVWNESGDVSGGSGLWAGSGGVSIAYVKPTWQAGAGVPSDGMRDVPDVSMAAAGHDGYLIWLYGQLNSVGGTSAAAPSFAGLMALVDQKTNAHQGLVNSILYPLATKQASGGAAVFHDITSGNNSVPGVTGFAATTGFDRASGLGSVDANVLVNNWSGAATATPSITLSASPASITVQAGKAASTTVSPAAVALNGAVSLTVTGAPSGLSAALASSSIAAPGSGSVVLNVTASTSVVPGSYSLTVKAVSGSQTASLAISVVVPAPGFTLSAAPASLTVAAGNSAQTALSLTPQNGFSAAVTLSASGLPAGVTATFATGTLPGTGGASSVTFTVAKTVSAGTYAVNVSANGGGITQVAAINLSVQAAPSFSLTTSVSSIGVLVGASAAVTVSATPQNGFNSAIALSVSGLPSGVTGVFSGNVLALAASSAAKAGTATLTITASGGGITKTAPVAVTVTVAPACQLAANPASVTLTAGQSVNASVSCAVTQGAFTAPLAITLTGAPTGMTATAAASLTAGSSVAMNISTGVTTPAGKYNLSLNASGNGYIQTIALPITVTAANTFILAGGSNAVTVQPGSNGQINLNTQAYGSYNSSVALAVTGVPSGVSATLSKSTIAAPGTGTSTVTFAANSSTKAGSYPVVMTASGGGVIQTVAVTLTIATGPSFTLALSATSVSIPQGGSGTITSSTGNYNGGFNGQLSLSYSGLAPGMNYSVASANSNNNTVNITMSLTVAASVAPGTYPVTVTCVGNSGSTATGNGVTRTATFNLIVTRK